MKNIKGEMMTLEELIYQESLKMDSGHIVKGCRECSEGLSQSILSWFKEILPNEKEYQYGQVETGCYWNHSSPYEYCSVCEGISIGKNQCLQDTLTNLTSKQGER